MTSGDARGQDDDRHAVGTRAKLRDQGEAVAVGKLAVEQDGGMDVGGNRFLRVRKRGGVIHHHVVAPERRRKRCGHLCLILDEQNPHGPAPQQH
jgi:hypothetical protein